MKKVISIIICLALCLSSLMLPTSAMAESAITIRCADVTCDPGDRITVDVTVENNPGFGLLVLTPQFSSELSLVELKNGNIISDFGSGPQQYMWLGDQDTTKNGLLLSITFDVSDNTKPGEYTAGFILRTCANYDEQRINAVIVPGKITVNCLHTFTTVHPAENSTCIKQGHAEYYTCDTCGEVVIGSDELLPFGNHVGGTATCLNKAICDVCKQPYGDYAAHRLTQH
ncbi:MAG: hypothetical protein KBS41_01735, partial [Oscillospiraceae bacterium]|nr:hypothetical protein [Candidatus Equicaccousia limihippi]